MIAPVKKTATEQNFFTERIVYWCKFSILHAFLANLNASSMRANNIQEIFGIKKADIETLNLIIKDK